MALIIAGNFESKAFADEAVARLRAEGISSADVQCISLNPPGQHDEPPDQAASSPESSPAKGAAAGAAIGGAVGLGVGVAAAPFVGPAGALAGAGVGAYVGSLIGTMGGLPDEAESTEERRAGILVAVRIDNLDARDRVAEFLRRSGARQLEIAKGGWRDGQWVDFDTKSKPFLIHSERQL